MPSTRIHFQNGRGEQLAARLEMPLDRTPRFYALFAHCFTCNKNLNAVRNIGRALTQKGIAVLRFDFTGLGESEGDFADTNFSSNIQDLEAAAAWLAAQHEAPSLLVGHSLGGAAVLHAAERLSSVQAVATVGAPADAAHVAHLFADQRERIEREGLAEARIGGRPFTIKKQFLDDIEAHRMQDVLGSLRKALLFMHSPQDQIVEVANAAHLYKAAHHPKSFISLDGADHLLSHKADSAYVGDVIASWAERYVDAPALHANSTGKASVGSAADHILDPSFQTPHQTAVRLGEEGFTTQIVAEQHHLLADEPVRVGGADLGPTPYDLLLASLGACTAMTLRMYADRKGWPLEQVTVHLDHYREHRQDSETDMDAGSAKGLMDKLDRAIHLQGPLDEAQRKRLLEIANRCPVHRTLENHPVVQTRLLEAPLDGKPCHEA
jgi:putative redox protein